jgi:hypothetical protein
MRVFALVTLLSATTSAAAPPAEAPAGSAPAAERVLPGGRGDGRECRNRFQVTPADTLAPPGPRVLTDLPPGDTVLAVYKEVEGCMEPVIVRYGDGRGPSSASLPAKPSAPRARLYR